MSQQETMAPTPSRHRMARSLTLNSEDGVDVDSEQSVNLLDDIRAGGADRRVGGADAPEGAVGHGEDITRAIKRALEPMMAELATVKKMNVALDKKMTSVVQKNEIQEKLLKEINARLNKDAEDVDKLLTAEGVVRLKVMCIENLDFKAKEDDEVGLLNTFIEVATEEGWLIKNTGKAQKDIFQFFRYKRNYLKSQIRLRTFQDLTNKTPEHAVELPVTMKFLCDTLGVNQLNEECLLIIYNYAYTVMKYLNKEQSTDNLSGPEMNSVKAARKNPWGFTMQRVEGDKGSRRKHTFVKNRFDNLLKTGQNFVPLG